MITSRIPSTTGGALMLGNLQGSYRRLVQLQDELSSGKQIRNPSDDPAGTVRALGTRNQLRRSQQFERNSADATGWLNTADSALTTAQGYLNRVRDLSVQARSGVTTPASADAIATEIEQIRDSLIQLGNTRYGNRAIFAGTGNTTSPVQATGQPDATANAAAVIRPIAPGVTMQVNTTADQIFGTWVGTAGGTYSGNVFETLTKLAADIRNPTAPGADIAAGQVALDAARTRMSAVQADLGAKAKRIEDVTTRNSAVSLELTSQLSDIEDIDLPKTIIEVQTQQMAYQAALSVSAKVIQPSLVDFMR